MCVSVWSRGRTGACHAWRIRAAHNLTGRNILMMLTEVMLGWMKTAWQLRLASISVTYICLAINFNHILITNHIWDCSGENVYHVVNDTFSSRSRRCDSDHQASCMLSMMKEATVSCAYMDEIGLYHNKPSACIWKYRQFLPWCPILNESILIGLYNQLTACALFDATLLLPTDLNTDYLTNEINQIIQIDEIHSFGFYVFWKHSLKYRTSIYTKHLCSTFTDKIPSNLQLSH